MKILRVLTLFLLALACCTACEKLAIATTPGKRAITSSSPLENQAEQLFWESLHQGNYEKIPQVLKLLTAAYLENPNNPKLAAHLGFTHMWKIAEMRREKKLDPLVVNHIILAKKYFSDAVELAPQDARVLGFYGDALLIQGKIFNDQKQQARGYFILKDAIRAWPQFNYFTAGYPMSTLPANSQEFIKGLEWQWQTLDTCAQKKIHRKNPDFSPYMKLETRTGEQRACWNSWIAPHNFEGFFLNMGDMLVKKGDYQTAIKIYNNAKLAKNYAKWKYRTVLEDRITHAKENVAKFNKTVNPFKPAKEPVMMFNSQFACMACHQE